MKLPLAADFVAASAAETLPYLAFKREHWRRLRTNNPLERLNREIRRRTRVVGAFPDGQSAVMLVSARLRHVAGTKRGTRKHLDFGPPPHVETAGAACRGGWHDDRRRPRLHRHGRWSNVRANPKGGRQGFFKYPLGGI